MTGILGAKKLNLVINKIQNYRSMTCYNLKQEPNPPTKLRIPIKIKICFRINCIFPFIRIKYMQKVRKKTSIATGPLVKTANPIEVAE